MASLTALDYAALGISAVAWLAYMTVIDRSPLTARTLSALMNRERTIWARRALVREVRIADTNILAGLQQGTAFFASAAALAIGGGLAMLGSGTEIAAVVSGAVPAANPTLAAFELKALGLIAIFVYGFFKFAWAYRLFNYASILLGALPPAERAHTADAIAAADRCAEFITLGGSHFNRGQRAFYLAVAYLGWFAGPWWLIAGSAGCIAVLAHRQFFSTARRVMERAAREG